MGACFPWRSLFRAVRASRASPDGIVVEPDGSYYVLTQFFNETTRKAVHFAPPVPALPRCSMCGLVPPRVFKSDSCRHVFCSLCEVHAQRNCPFDYTAWRRATTDDAALELVSRASLFCWNRGEGCEYSGSLSELPSHYRLCPYYRTRCGLCGQGVLMKDLNLHAKCFCPCSKDLQKQEPRDAMTIPLVLKHDTSHVLVERDAGLNAGAQNLP
uniref:Putative tnf receptor-associated factor ovary overexpressed n=1 Tax=Rhipicephalus microplus TaxID=6941 RepID=A0A6M2D394_RHIMP